MNSWYKFKAWVGLVMLLLALAPIMPMFLTEAASDIREQMADESGKGTSANFPLPSP